MVSIEHVSLGKPIWVAREEGIAPYKWKTVPYKMEHYIVTIGVYGTNDPPSIWNVHQSSGPSYNYDIIFEDEQSCIKFCDRDNKLGRRC